MKLLYYNISFNARSNKISRNILYPPNDNVEKHLKQFDKMKQSHIDKANELIKEEMKKMEFNYENFEKAFEVPEFDVDFEEEKLKKSVTQHQQIYDMKYQDDFENLQETLDLFNENQKNSLSTSKPQIIS
jgi:hypothetical protein